MRIAIRTPLISAIALTAVACASEAPESDAMAEADVVDQSGAANEEVALPTVAELDEAALENFDKLDYRAVKDEYERNLEVAQTEIRDETETTADALTSSTAPERQELDFATLDLSDDGKLSVAEYAIWALPNESDGPDESFELRPYLTNYEINKVGSAFFYFDDNGDRFLSKNEFADARDYMTG